MATMLLVGAGLLTRSLVRLQEVSPGFDPGGVLVADAPLSPVKYATAAERNVFVDRLRERARRLPGVTFAEVATSPPFSGNGSTIHFNITGRPPKGSGGLHHHRLSRGQRRLLRRARRCRWSPADLQHRDRDQSPPVAIVNETFVRRFLGGAAKQGSARARSSGRCPRTSRRRWRSSASSATRSRRSRRRRSRRCTCRTCSIRSRFSAGCTETCRSC